MCRAEKGLPNRSSAVFDLSSPRSFSFLVDQGAGRGHAYSKKHQLNIASAECKVMDRLTKKVLALC